MLLILKKEMQAAEVKHEVVVLKDAKHGFSNPLADERAKANGVDLGYNSEAEKQGLAKMYALLERTLKIKEANLEQMVLFSHLLP